MDFTEFILICEEKGSEGRLVGSILTMYSVFNSLAPVLHIKCSYEVSEGIKPLNNFLSYSLG